jgi:hypothetical protein
VPPLGAERCIRCKVAPAGWTPTLCGGCGRQIAWEWFVFNKKDVMPWACEDRAYNGVFRNYCNRLQNKSRRMWRRHGQGPQV